MQTKKNSFREACVNTLIGFIITLVFSPFIYSLCGMQYSPIQLGAVTVCFTIISVARSYVIRRFFNKKSTLSTAPKKLIDGSGCPHCGGTIMKLKEGSFCEEFGCKWTERSSWT